MATSVTRTDHANLIPSVWEPAVEFQAQQPRGVAQRIWDVSSRVKGKGNVYKVNILPKLAVAQTAGSPGTWVAPPTSVLQAWSSGGTASYASTLTPFLITLTTTLKYVGITIDPDVEEYSVTGLADAYAPVVAEAIYQGVDIDVLNLYSHLASGDNVGTATTNWNEADFLLGLSRLYSNGKDKLVPGTTPIFGVYDLGQIDNVLSFAGVSNAAVRGEKNGAYMTGRIGLVYGVDLMFTGNVMSSSGRRNMIFAKKAFMYGRKSNAKIETDRQDLITKIIATCSWGSTSAHSNTTYGGSGSDLAIQHLTA